MAWRIEDSVQRGELDNRERGIVRGKIWLHGLTDPIIVELRGDACPDLAGCLLNFENPGETFPLHTDGLSALQTGVVGDLTASRKVRVVEILEEDLSGDEPKAFPEHWANSLYLEWFSETNGRVVIESANYKLTLSPPLWKLSPEEDEQRKKDAAAGFADFMKQFDAALESSVHHPPEDKQWDEFDYERFMRESDARTDKYMELLEKYGDDPESEDIISREMGWDQENQEAEWELEAVEDSSLAGQSEEKIEFGELPPSLEDFPALEPDATTEGVDWIRREDGDICHPLYARCFEGTVSLMDKCEESGFLKRDDRDLDMLLGEYQITTAKLAGALNGLAYGRDLQEGPFIVARLKRALAHLHNTQAALEAVAAKKVFPSDLSDSVRSELFSIREEILRLMQEFRAKE
ncbi:MAG: hypothetical protein H0X66_13530 [Verrucomicrobia bacterium]|nr:hypothetical protein [Verrucomicrobiota bacterium]